MDILTTLKLAIEKKLCPVHDIHPLVEITGGDLEITCCCELFYSRCLQDVGNIKYQLELERSEG